MLGILAAIDEYLEACAGHVWRELRGNVWHATSSDRLPLILAANEIQPHPALPPDEFIWAKQYTTFCRERDGVSLFDFASADWTVAFRAGMQTEWLQFLRARNETPTIERDKWVSTVWLSVNWRDLPGFMSAPVARVEARIAYTHKWMAGIEGCHHGPIPLSACSHAIIVCAVEREDFRRVEIGPSMLDEIAELETGWLEKHADKYAFRALSEREQFLSPLAARPEPFRTPAEEAELAEGLAEGRERLRRLDIARGKKD